MVKKSDVVVRISSDTTKYNKGMEDAGNSTKAFTIAAAAAFVLVTASIVKAINASKNYEAAMKQIQKTTGLAGDELAELDIELQKLIADLPIATEDLLQITKIAGQLGITGAKNLTKFTAVVAKFSATTGVAAATAAEQLARLSNLTKLSIDDVEKLASAITFLGSTTVAREGEILEMSVSIAKAGAAFDLAAKDAVGIATAFIEIGVQADLAGTISSKVFIALNKTIRGGGKSLEQLAELTGLASEEMAGLLVNDPAVLFDKFVQGLNKASKEGKSLNKVMGDFGLKGIQIDKVLPALAANAETLSKALKGSNEEFEKGTRLGEEAKIQFDTTAAAEQQLINVTLLLAKTVGDELKPAYDEFVEGLFNAINGLIEFVKWVAESDSIGSKMVGTIFQIITAIGLTVIAIKTIIGVMALYKGAMALVATANAIVGLSFVKLGIVMTAWGITARRALISSGIGISVALAGIAINTLIDVFSDQKDGAKDLTEANNDATESIKNLTKEQQEALDVLEKEDKALQEKINKEKAINEERIANTELEKVLTAQRIAQLEKESTAIKNNRDFLLDIESKFAKAKQELSSQLSKALADDKSIENDILIENLELKLALLEKEEAFQIASAERKKARDLENLELRRLQAELAFEDVLEAEIEFQTRRLQIQSDFADAEIEKDEEKKAAKLAALEAEHALLKKEEDKFRKEQEFETQRFLERLVGFNQDAGFTKVKNNQEVNDLIADNFAEAAQNLFGENKIFQLAMIGLNTAAGIMQAFANLPPPTSFIAAASIGAVGATQAAKVSGIGFATGGLVPGVGSGDSVPAMLTPGELVATKDTSESAALGIVRGMQNRGLNAGGASMNMTVNITVEGSILGDEEALAETLIPPMKKLMEDRNFENLG